LKNKNPHNLCTWDDQADCADCPQRDRLHCKWEGRLLAAFLLVFLPFGFRVFFTFPRVYFRARFASFSCPLNKVPKPEVDAYLMRNAVIKEAWEKGGHRLG